MFERFKKIKLSNDDKFLLFIVVYLLIAAIIYVLLCPSRTCFGVQWN